MKLYGAHLYPSALLEKCMADYAVSLDVTDDAIAKLYVLKSFVKYREMIENFVTLS